MGTHGDVYVSLPSAQADCSDLGLPVLSSGSYHCSTSANYRNIDGTGWIPVNLASVQSSAGTLFSSLPIDPVNTVANGYYYTYIPGSWALSATMESEKYLAANAANDGGQKSTRFEIGNNLSLDTALGTDVAGGGGPGTVTVTAINSKFAYNNASISLTSVTGTGFVSGATLKLTKSGQSDITCTGFTIASATSITGGSCPITGAAVGTWNVVVTNTDTGTGTGSNLFSILSSSGLTGYWKFNENTGTSVYDSSGNGNNGSINGASWVAGKSGSGLSFNGSSSYVEVPDSSTVDQLSSFSWTAWVYISGYGDYREILTKQSTNQGGNYEIRINPDGILSFAAFTNSVNVISVNVVPLDQWVLLSGVFTSGSKVELYINGSLNNSVSTGVTTYGSNSDTLKIGKRADGLFFSGLIDEVAMYNRALSGSEILSIYNAQN